ncbi:MAG: hypothetical protein AAB350_01660 [Patescibacteria group bacterium]
MNAFRFTNEHGYVLQGHNDYIALHIPKGKCIRCDGEGSFLLCSLKTANCVVTLPRKRQGSDCAEGSFEPLEEQGVIIIEDFDVEKQTLPQTFAEVQEKFGRVPSVG